LSYYCTNKTISLKQLTQLFYLLFVLAISACQSDSTITLQKIIVEDQAFTLSVNSHEGAKVGQVVVSQPINIPLRFQLVAGDYSHAFTLDESTGELFLQDTNVLLSIPVGIVELEVLVSSYDTQCVYGEIVSVTINISDLPDNVTAATLRLISAPQNFCMSIHGRLVYSQ